MLRTEILIRLEFVCEELMCRFEIVQSGTEIVLIYTPGLILIYYFIQINLSRLNLLHVKKVVWIFFPFFIYFI
jgi:hypothetical protein